MVMRSLILVQSSLVERLLLYERVYWTDIRWMLHHNYSIDIYHVKIIFPSSKIPLVQKNIIDNVHIHLLTKLICRKRHKNTRDAESTEKMKLIMCNNRCPLEHQCLL